MGCVCVGCMCVCGHEGTESRASYKCICMCGDDVGFTTSAGVCAYTWMCVYLVPSDVVHFRYYFESPCRTRVVLFLLEEELKT